MSAVLGGGVAFLILLALVAIPIAIWTWLIFPNVDGMFQDLDWYNYDEMSQHFLYWTGFWFTALGWSRLAIGQSGRK